MHNAIIIQVKKIEYPGTRCSLLRHETIVPYFPSLLLLSVHTIIRQPESLLFGIVKIAVYTTLYSRTTGQTASRAAEQSLEALKQCLSMCTTESLDEQIFSKILPKAHHFLSEVLKDIDNIITDNNINIDDLDDVKRKLDISDGLLVFWKRCLECVSALGNVRACYVFSLCDILPKIVIIVFKHCKASSKYGVLLNGTIQELRNLFAKASSIFKLFFTALDSVIVFDMNVQSEMELLMKVIDAYGDVASIANGMDTKTFVEFTEAFFKLAIVHQNNIKPCSITTHLGRMAKDISYFLYLYLHLTKDGEKILPISAASFLDIIFNHDNFKQVYFEYGRQITSNGKYEHRLAYQLLTIAIMKKINRMPYECHCKWSLVEEEICTEKSRLLGAHEIGERPRLINIYEATLVPVCGLVTQITPEAFCTVELLLLKHLLSGCLWSSLLSSDVWYFIARVGTSQLCANHINYLIKISAVLRERSDSIEAVMVDNTIVRLYELLTADVKISLIGDLVDLDILNHSASYIVYFLTPKAKVVYSEYQHDFKNLSKIFWNLQEYPSVHNWKLLRRHLSPVVAVDYSGNENVTDILPKIWSFVSDAVTECDSKQLDILSNLIVILLHVTHLRSFQDDVSHLILTSIENSCVCLLSRGKIEVCQFLQKCVEDFDRYAVQAIALNLTGLFGRLLQTDSPWVRQETLETFERVGHVCSEQLVAEIARILAKISDVNNIMQAYLSSKPCYTLTGFADVQNYFKHLARAFQNCRKEHTCYEYYESKKEEKIPRLEKMESLQNIIVPVSTQLDAQAEELYRELTKVLEGQAVVNNTVCRKLKTILEKILDGSEK
ncbi:hypothetical protein X777_07211 [Ooceraea biroi]|uniref:Uncharacterized protein n=1 Tax=Ooceraea biroi TaxID=2015173 RepID=A0A026WAM3_OOCBI|nr:hypothetical protein X777_07211 [Ooceraea biroi]